jgi:hypothetical protein
MLPVFVLFGLQRAGVKYSMEDDWKSRTLLGSKYWSLLLQSGYETAVWIGVEIEA